MPYFMDWSSPAVQGVLGTLYIVLALVVTADVLLKKSDVRSALGWIAAAWLSPVLGALLYYLFGINRVTRRALKMKRREKAGGQPRPAALAPAGAELARMNGTSANITGGELVDGNRIAILEGGDEAYPDMLAAIEGARHSVAMTSYIFRNDATGRQFADALIAAKQRGVAVRVLLDSIGTGYIYSPIFHRLRRHGVPVARFLHTWLPWRMPFLNMRNHRKLLIADGALAFTGGMNISDQHAASRAAAGKSYVRDMHFRIEGPGVARMVETFASDWTFTTGEALDDDIWWPELAACGAMAARAVRSGPDHDIYRIEMMVGTALSLASKRLRIVTPYFLPDVRLQFSIALAVLRGVEVDIVLPEKSDSFYMDWAMRGNLRFYRYIGANIYVTPPPFDHTKLVVMDGGWSLIGSSNWDARSFRLNFEFDLECYDGELASRLDAAIDDRIARAKPLSPDMLAAEPVWKRLRNALARLLMPYL